MSKFIPTGYNPFGRKGKLSTDLNLFCVCRGQDAILSHQGVLAFFPLRMDFNAFDGTHNLALRFAVMTDAFRARGRINDVDLFAHRDGIIGTLWLAHVAIDALVGDA